MIDKRLKSLADRIERLMDERDGIQSEIRDIYVEAKSAGYVPKVLRKAITRKRMDQDKRSEEDAILGLYEDALSPSMRRAVQMAKAGATSREIETETGIDHVTVTRSVSLNKKSETHNPDTGEITETRNTQDMQASDPAPQGSSRPGAPEVGEVFTLAGLPVPEGGEGTGTFSDEALTTPSVGAVAAEPRVAPPFLGDDPGEPPPFLRRTAQGRGA